MQPSIHRPTTITIDRQALRQNYLTFRQLAGPQRQVFAVVKADAYHHGAVEVAKTLQEVQVDGFCVATIDEALQLRQANITEPILVLNVVPVEQAPLAAQHDISLTVDSYEWLVQASKQVKTPVKVHLAIDTGMGRIGFRMPVDKASLLAACQILEQSPLLIPEGIFTHFATADEQNSAYFQQQWDSFEQTVAALPLKFSYVHMANTATAMWAPTLDNSNLVRLGIGLYGLSPAGKLRSDVALSLKPALSLTSQIVAVRQLQAGDKVGYGATYTVQAESEWIATVPLGYADGWHRNLSGSSVLVAGHKCPIVGRICMDQLMIKVPKRYALGTTVTLIGTQDQQTISVDDVASYGQTINYEILCSLSERIPRTYIN